MAAAASYQFYYNPHVSHWNVRLVTAGIALLCNGVKFNTLFSQCAQSCLHTDFKNDA